MHHAELAAIHQLLQSARPGEARAACHALLAREPGSADAHCMLGRALNDLNELEAAAAAYRRAIELQPGLVEAHCNLGIILRRQGKMQATLACFQNAIAIQPDVPELYNNLGLALHESGRSAEALAEYRRALALRPDFANAHNNLATALLALGQTAEAFVHYQTAARLNPNSQAIFNNLANLMKKTGQIDQAIACYDRAMKIGPANAEVFGNLASALKDAGHLDAALAYHDRAIATRPDWPKALADKLYTIHFHPAYDASAIYREHQRWNQLHAQPLAKRIEPHRNDRTPDRRLRIGYVSPDFREHAISRFLLPLLKHHDHTAFEIFLYFDIVEADAMTELLRQCADQWRSTIGLSDEQFAHMVREDQIDILIDLTSHMGSGRLLAFARKPAPVQVTYLAYCSTTGLDTMDYRLTDPYLDPSGAKAGNVYSEKSIRLPVSYWCYGRPVSGDGEESKKQVTTQGNIDDAASEEFHEGPDSSAFNPALRRASETGVAVIKPLRFKPSLLPALSAGHVTFGCLNNFCKISPPAAEAWQRIMKAVPGSRLLLHAAEGNHRNLFKERFAKAGIDPGRIEFVGFMKLADYFRQYDRIDLALDPFPYAGGTTTCDALWMGVPVVSVTGSTAVSRAGLSILSNVGLAELVASTIADYEMLAVKLAHDLPRLAQLRATLRHRMERSPLMDATRFARDVETAYRWSWREYLRGNAASGA